MRLLAVGAVATVVVGFVVGFALGGRSSDRDDAVTASGAPSSTTTAAPATTAGPTSTTVAAPPSTTAAPSTTSTTAVVVTTVAPTTTVAVTPSTVAVTVAPPTTVAPTVVPSRVVVSYATDGRGRLIIPRSGSANLVITNEGGLAQQWLVTGTGFTTVGASQGTLGPGQTVAVTLVAPPGELPSGEIGGLISVLGAVNPSIAFVIPPA